MKKTRNNMMAIVLMLLVGLATANTSNAQDPTNVAPDIYKVLLDNAQVRVLDINLRPGGTSAMHSHPNYVVYTLTTGKVRFSAPDGKSTEVELKAGEAIWRPAETHAVENIGGTDVHVLNIEVKQSSAAAPTSPPKP